MLICKKCGMLLKKEITSCPECGSKHLEKKPFKCPECEEDLGEARNVDLNSVGWCCKRCDIKIYKTTKLLVR